MSTKNNEVIIKSVGVRIAYMGEIHPHLFISICLHGLCCYNGMLIIIIVFYVCFQTVSPIISL